MQSPSNLPEHPSNYMDIYVVKWFRTLYMQEVICMIYTCQTQSSRQTWNVSCMLLMRITLCRLVSWAFISNRDFTGDWEIVNHNDLCCEKHTLSLLFHKDTHITELLIRADRGVWEVVGSRDHRSPCLISLCTVMGWRGCGLR